MKWTHRRIGAWSWTSATKWDRQQMGRFPIRGEIRGRLPKCIIMRLQSFHFALGNPMLNIQRSWLVIGNVGLEGIIWLFYTCHNSPIFVFFESRIWHVWALFWNRPKCLLSRRQFFSDNARPSTMYLTIEYLKYTVFCHCQSPLSKRNATTRSKKIKDVYCSSIDYRSKANKQCWHKWLVSSCISATFLLRSCFPNGGG
jgi:hypothetical protein